MSQDARATMARALEVFARGFADTRCYSHPCLAEKVGKLWHLKDGPRRNDKGYRREEWIGCDLPAKRFDEAAREHSQNKHCVSAICLVGRSDEKLREEFKEMGYRLNVTEPFMVHDLKRISRGSSPADIVRVMSEDLADALTKAARARQILPEHLHKDAHIRAYVALMEGTPVGWVRSHDVGGATWCANAFVKPAFRRQGIARAMMSRLLRDDRKFGSKLAVLTASHAGAKLYPLLGYRQIGTLLFFTPPKSHPTRNRQV